MTPDETYRAVMRVDPPPVDTPFAAASRDFVFGQVSAYYGFAKGEALHEAAQRWRASKS